MRHLVFGYGSLVNEESLSGPAILRPASISGWVRQWRHCKTAPSGGVCVLTVARLENSVIDGAVLEAGQSLFDEIVKRETGYSMVSENALYASSDEPQPVTTTLFVGNSEYNRPGDGNFPIWQSYLDCVFAGFLRHLGRPGLERFIKTTQGWEAPILMDRDSPLYVRAVKLSDYEKSVIDGVLAERGLLKP